DPYRTIGQRPWTNAGAALRQNMISSAEGLGRLPVARQGTTESARLLPHRRSDTVALMGSLPSIIGPYRVIRQLGEGGMGAVFEAVHEVIQRRVAIKILHPEAGR